MEKKYETLGGGRKFYIGYLWFGAFISAAIWIVAIFSSANEFSAEAASIALGFIGIYTGLIYGSQKAIIQRKTGHIMLYSFAFLFIAPIHTLFHWLAASATQRENKAEMEKSEQLNSINGNAIHAA